MQKGFNEELVGQLQLMLEHVYSKMIQKLKLSLEIVHFGIILLAIPTVEYVAVLNFQTEDCLIELVFYSKLRSQ